MKLLLSFNEINERINDDNNETDQESPGFKIEVPPLSIDSAYDLLDQMRESSTTEELFQEQCELAYNDDSPEGWRAVSTIALLREAADKVDAVFKVSVSSDGIVLNTEGEGKTLISKSY